MSDRYTRWSQVLEGARVEILLRRGEWLLGTVEWSLDEPDYKEAAVKLDRNGATLMVRRLSDIRPLPEPRLCAWETEEAPV